ncbi:MAG: type VI secretion system tip protein VgrG, partial [Candidatus Hydrogenedentes bacterium]|nr:type VI secretion system tip protein VgrG [Candidatus Hydrogenedentota bacterium]
FHGDRYGKQDENDSCWIRVSQFWAGKHWGAIHIPRMDQEVVVEFLEGDPDRPLITGRVYNREQMPPWDLPRHKTQSGILTRSTLHGTQSDANLIRFEDKKGEEELHVHAQRNLVTVVEKDEIRWVWENSHITTWKDHIEHVNGNMQLLVGTEGGNQDVWVSGNKTETIGANNDFHV